MLEVVFWEPNSSPNAIFTLYLWYSGDHCDTCCIPSNFEVVNQQALRDSHVMSLEARKLLSNALLSQPRCACKLRAKTPLHLILECQRQRSTTAWHCLLVRQSVTSSVHIFGYGPTTSYLTRSWLTRTCFVNSSMVCLQMRRMSCSAVEGPRGGRCETRLVEIERRKKEGPTWEAFRSRIFSFARSSTQGLVGLRSPVLRSSRSPATTPTSRSPSMRSPASTSPASRSPANRSPSSRSPASRSPSTRSPASRSPARSPSRASTSKTPVQSPVTPLHRSPSSCSPPTNINFQNPKRRGSRGSRESLSGPDTPTSVKTIPRKDSPTLETPSGVKAKRGRLRTFSLSLEGSEPGSINSSLDSPSTPSCSSGRKAQLKIRSNSQTGPQMESGRRMSIEQNSFELSQIDDEINMEVAAQRPRKWSYHGTASPSTPVDMPKRHSFSTGSEQPHGNSGTMSGIVVSNSDLLSLMQPSQLLALPGLADLKQFRTVMPRAPPANPKPRGRSQSIAVCALSAPLLPLQSVGGPPIIRTTDCDHEASVLARSATLEDQDEESEQEGTPDATDKTAEKLVWDSSGSTVDVGLLGSVIESYLKISTEDESQATKKESSGGLTPACSRLQVK
ncbi:hypothetical protein FHG87_000022 [Trinorchestia longiramus]|nr:hypothetical protein FHG87_000022 [Trinorchestia longiramus]